MKTGMKNRDSFWDIFKGLAIIMVVFGHTALYGGAYVYLFHLPLFFFVSGFLYSDSRFTGHPGRYLEKKICGSWPKYAFYGCGMILIHNYLVRHGMMPAGIAGYQGRDIIQNMERTCLFQSTELHAGAMWFIPLWIVSGTLFCLIRTGSLYTGKHKTSVQIILSLFSAAAGIVLVKSDIHFIYYLEKALLVVPFFTMGRLYADSGRFGTLLFRQKKLKAVFKTAAVGIITMLCLHMCNRMGLYIDLSQGNTGGFLFYPIAAVGILHTLCLTDILSGCSISGRVLSAFGRYSFDIMALHMLFFKVAQQLLRKLYYRDPGMDISGFPLGIARNDYLLGILIMAFSLLAATAAGILFDASAGFFSVRIKQLSDKVLQSDEQS